MGDNRHSAVCIQRHGGHHQPSARHVGFKQHTDLAAQEPRVDALYDWLEFSRKIRKLHDLFAVHQVPPLHVAVVICGEVSEDRMVAFDVKPCGVGRTHLEPTRVPEHGRELLHNVFSIRNLSGSRHQHLASCLQHLSGFLVQAVRDVHVAGVHAGQIVQRCLGIHPKVPMVPASHFFLAAIEVIRPLQHHLEYHLPRHIYLVQSNRHVAQTDVVAQSHITVVQSPFRICFPVLVADAVGHFCVTNRRFAIMGHLNRRRKSVPVPIGELGYARQQHRRRTELPEIFR